MCMCVCVWGVGGDKPGMSVLGGGQGTRTRKSVEVANM